MSWIKITQYLPGDTRRIQIWNDPKSANFDDYQSGETGNYIGYFQPNTGKFIGVVSPYGKDNFQIELSHPTHWAELLGEPEDLKKTI